MGNRPHKNYDYNRPGVAMVTLKTRPGMWLCRITPGTFNLTDTGRRVQQGLLGISGFYEQVKLGQYQIMPDHLHAMVHVVRKLPEGVTLQRVIRGFKIGVNRACREAAGVKEFKIFEKGMHHSLVFSREHLDREVVYIRDNVRRLRLRRANPHLFRKPKKVMTTPDGIDLWGIGNHFLLQHPRRIRIQFSRRTPESSWPAILEDLEYYLEQGFVFVSPFISPFERRALTEIIDRGGRAIHLTHVFMSERYKPGGRLFDLCCEGRLLELSVASAFTRGAKLDRAACLRMNEVAKAVASGK